MVLFFLMKWQQYIRDIPDWPKPGILFRDITPLLQHNDAFKAVIHELAHAVAPLKPQTLVGAEARGFIFGAAVALELGAGFVPIRKKGKLPSETIEVTYDLEYGTDTLEMHNDAVQSGERVVFIDDLLATGGTTAACLQLIRKCRADIAGSAFVIELAGLNGRGRLPADMPCISLLTL